MAESEGVKKWLNNRVASEENGVEQFRDRIIERRKMRAGDLTPFRLNPAHHPRKQIERMHAILEKWGKVSPLVAWYSAENDGALSCFDGHLRQMIDPDELWWVDITDLSDEEAVELILFYDPIGGLSETKAPEFAVLSEETRRGEELPSPLDAFLTEMEVEIWGRRRAGDDKETLLDQAVQLKPPKEYAVIVCESAEEWERLSKILRLQYVRRGGYKPGSPFDAVGLNRVVKAADFLSYWADRVPDIGSDGSGAGNNAHCHPQ